MRNLMFGCVLAMLASLSANAWSRKTFQEQSLPSGAEANRPYEIVWAGRTQDDHPSLSD